MHLLNTLIYAQKDPYRLVKVFLGCIFLLCGVLLAIYLIYTALLPYLGELQSGGVAAYVLSLIGLSLLLFKSDREEEGQLETANKLISELKGIDVAQSLKDHPWYGLLVSLIAGIALSQVKDLKGVTELYEKLKSR